jgi:hypothetical protein
MFRWGAGLSSLLALTGCASTQLNYNTADIAASVDSVYLNQTLSNLSKTIENNFALPSQVDLAAGQVQTSNSITPSANFPLAESVTRNGLHALSQTVWPNAGMTVAASDGWQQNWTIQPVIDGDDLRNLRALYRYVVVEDADIRREYKPAATLDGNKYVPDPYALQEPHCVLCGPRLIPNKTLHKGWLYWTSDPGSPVLGRLPPPGAATVRLGHFGAHELLMTERDYQAGYLQDFVLFVMGAGGGPSGGGKGGAGGNPKKRYNLNLGINPGIQPIQPTTP